ncbi:MAG TPA: DUF4363 family protein [Syntrophomonadaceae bacterium]|nr:DUF4363 family protein [Syntrophomonadaceae bacterium]
MRLVASIIVLIGLIISGGLWTNHALQISTDHLTRQIQQVNSEIKQDSWEAAGRQTIRLEKMWKKEAKWWPVVLDHQEMDNIDFSLARVKEYVASRNSSLALGQLSEVKIMLEHIPKKEAVTLENIL